MTLQHPSRTAQVMAAIESRIARRALVAGDRLPSIRGLARELAVSPSTVVEAYDRLVATGAIRARRGSGFYVSAPVAPLMLAEQSPPQGRAVDPLWVSRQSLDAAPAALMPGCGWLPPAWMPLATLRQALRGVARGSEAVLTSYGGAQGAAALRSQLLRRLAGQGLELASNQLMLTASGAQAIDLICRFLLRPGDTVLLDDPCYFNFQALLRAHALRAVSVPYTPSGPDPEAFARVVAAEHPRLYITNTGLHNPTGATLSAAVAHRILGIAAASSMTIVEDDIFGAFEPEPSLRLAMLDGLRHVIHIGSFSKTISASLRCGYIAARPDWIEGLTDFQVATNFGGPSPVAAEVVSAVLASGGYRKHLEDLRAKLVRARRQVAGRLEPLGITPWLMPRGGFYLWCHLPEGIDGASLAKEGQARGLVLAPGNVFSVAQTAASMMRFNAAQSLDPRIIPLLRDSLAAAAA